MMKLLALDFDGVISDSAPESFLVALRTYTELRPGTPLVQRAAPSSIAGDAPAPSPAAVVAEPLYAGFVEHMPLGNRAEDYAAVLEALERDVPLPDQDAYDAFRAGLDADWLRDYHRRFYQQRSALMKRDPEGWQALIGPYTSFLAVLRRRRGEARFAIATAKDRRSVAALLRHYGIDDLFDPALVLDKETGVTKVAHLEHLQRTLGVAFPEITFVDDKVNHLDAVAHLEVVCGLATWGYNGEREAALARRRGYRVLQITDAEAQLFESGA